MTVLKHREVPLGIRLYHFAQSDDWPMIKKLAEGILDREMKKMMDEVDPVIRKEMLNDIHRYRKFWKKFKVIILNSIENPNEKETY